MTEHEIHVETERYNSACGECVAQRAVQLREIDRRTRHAGECPSRSAEYSESDCECGASLVFKSMGSSAAGSPVAERSFYDFPTDTVGVVVALGDGRTITIADLGAGPVVRVQGPNDELLADWGLPASAQDVPEGGIAQYQRESR
jgi:hypothetical protein